MCVSSLPLHGFSFREIFDTEIPLSLLSSIQNIHLSIQGNINLLKQLHYKLKGKYFEFKPKLCH